MVELAPAGSTEVGLDGIPDPGHSAMPLADWRAVVLPQVDWARLDLPCLLDESFRAVKGDPADRGAVAGAAARTGGGRWASLRSGPLLVRPTSDVWEAGRLRGVENPASDPVSFALLDGRAGASFPDVRGWSALDRARRAVAEHGAWLRDRHDRPHSRPGWVGGRPTVTWSTPGTLGLLLSAARAALFLQSLDDGTPSLALTRQATVQALARWDAGAGEVAGAGLDALRASERDGQQPPVEDVAQLRHIVSELPAYSPGALQKRPEAVSR
jgi:hypothetical protein